MNQRLAFASLALVVNSACTIPRPLYLPEGTLFISPVTETLPESFPELHYIPNREDFLYLGESPDIPEPTAMAYSR